MTDLETRLAEARKTLSLGLHGFDTAAAIAREVVAEREKKISRLEDDLGLAKNSEIVLQGILDSSLAEKDAEIERLKQELAVERSKGDV